MFFHFEYFRKGFGNLLLFQPFYAVLEILFLGFDVGYVFPKDQLVPTVYGFLDLYIILFVSKAVEHPVFGLLVSNSVLEAV